MLDQRDRGKEGGGRKKCDVWKGNEPSVLVHAYHDFFFSLSTCTFRVGEELPFLLYWTWKKILWSWYVAQARSMFNHPTFSLIVYKFIMVKR